MTTTGSALVILTFTDLAVCGLLVLALALLVRLMRLGIETQIVVAACRTVVQLMAVGMVLKLVFSNISPLYLLLMATVMLCSASFEVLSRQKRKLNWKKGLMASSSAMFISSFIITVSALLLIIEADPWYTPQYAIPLLGMLLGNTMNGISLGIDRLIQNAWQQRAVIEQKLMLGYRADRAIAHIKHESVRAAMIPSINSMAAAGLVSLPGMMTGQILAGSPPIEAVKYQIFIMFLIVAGTGFGVMAALSMISRMLFDKRERLRFETILDKTHIT
jgi:putative ABC transport system permease protein